MPGRAAEARQRLSIAARNGRFWAWLIDVIVADQRPRLLDRPSGTTAIGAGLDPHEPPSGVDPGGPAARESAGPPPVGADRRGRHPGLAIGSAEEEI